MSTRIIPPVSELTQPYWDAGRQGEFKVQQCDDCGHRSFPPRTHCPSCGSGQLTWETMSGTGTVWLQSLPFSRLADRVIASAPRAGGSDKGEGSLLGGVGRLLDGDN